MTSTRRSFLSWSASCLLLRANSGSPVRRLKTPAGGLQPQAAVDRQGTIHLVYLYGDPAAADVGYVRKRRDEAEFSAPVRVNDRPGSAISLGTVRGAHLAIGKAGRVHVAWNGSSKIEPKAPNNSAPMFYTRLTDRGDGFEPQRNVMKISGGLDGGGTVAADDFGNVYVTWHGQGQQNGQPLRGEQYRRVWLARSDDEGKTFETEVPVSPAELGACGCCGMGALADASGNLYLLFRSARELVHRDMYLLMSRNRGKTFRATNLSSWEIGACPMSTVAFSSDKQSVLLAWEKENQICFAAIDQRSGSIGPAMEVPGAGRKRKHPSIAVSRTGDLLLAWTEDTGWSKGGSLLWQVFSRAGQPLSPPERFPDLPAWGSPSAAFSGNEFVVVC